MKQNNLYMRTWTRPVRGALAPVRWVAAGCNFNFAKININNKFNKRQQKTLSGFPEIDGFWVINKIQGTGTYIEMYLRLKHK